MLGTPWPRSRWLLMELPSGVCGALVALVRISPPGQPSKTLDELLGIASDWRQDEASVKSLLLRSLLAWSVVERNAPSRSGRRLDCWLARGDRPISEHRGSPVAPCEVNTTNEAVRYRPRNQTQTPPGALGRTAHADVRPRYAPLPPVRRPPRAHRADRSPPHRAAGPAGDAPARRTTCARAGAAPTTTQLAIRGVTPGTVRRGRRPASRLPAPSAHEVPAKAGGLPAHRATG